jgi:hypothetical protein
MTDSNNDVHNKGNIAEVMLHHLTPNSWIVFDNVHFITPQFVEISCYFYSCKETKLK